MYIPSRFHVLVFIIAVLIISSPHLVLAQQNQGMLGARAAAIQDAQNDVNKLLWGGGSFLLGIAGGCLLGSAGVIGASVYQPDPPAQRLIGKPPQYVLAYTKAYKAKVKRTQLRYASVGCMGGTVVAGIFWGTYYYRSR